MKPDSTLSRRAWLRRSAALSAAGAGIATGVSAQPASNLPPQVPQWMTTPGGSFLNPPYGRLKQRTARRLF